MKTKVLITESRRNSSLLTAVALAKDQFEIHGMDNVRLPFNAHHGSLATNCFLPQYNHPDFENSFFNLVDDIKPDILIPFQKNRWAVHFQKTLRGKCHFLLPDLESFESCYDKVNCYREAKKFGIACPEIYSYDEAIGILKDNFRKEDPRILVLKPRWDFGGARGLHYIKKVSELEEIYSANEKKYGKLLIQEYIPGPTCQMIAINVLYDQDSRLIGHFSFRKIRQFPASGGNTGLGVSTEARDLLTKCDELLRHLQWKGPADIEFKIDPRNQVAYLMEINTRFTGALHFSYAYGINFPLLYCKAAMGEHLPSDLSPQYPLGKSWINTLFFTKSIISEFLHTQKRHQANSKIWKEMVSAKWNIKAQKLDVVFLAAKLLNRVSEP